MNKPIAFLYCHQCGEPGLELYVTSRSVGAVCVECRSFAFEIVDLRKFITTSLFRVDALPEKEVTVN